MINQDLSKHQINTITGNNPASTKRCRERGSENASRVKQSSEDASRGKQSIGGVVPLQPARPRRGDTS
jgi:hypothetical protein